MIIIVSISIANLDKNPDLLTSRDKKGGQNAPNVVICREQLRNQGHTRSILIFGALSRNGFVNLK